MNLQQSILLSNLNRGPKILSANALKWMALITMIIDHVGAGILERGFVQTSSAAYSADVILRAIGRLSFPLYCFLLVEGYEHTRSKPKYMLAMMVAGLISEVPFDYCFFGRINLQYQNVFFTLLLGLMGMHLCRWLEEYEIPFVLGFEVMVFTIIGAMAEVLHTDYSWRGIILIAVLYLTRNMGILKCILGVIAIAYEYPAVYAFIPIYLYNGIRRNDINKYIFYAIYPIHLTIIYFLDRLLIGILLG